MTAIGQERTFEQSSIALLGLPMAWARIYLGVHYPGDMVGAFAVFGFATLSI